MKNLFLIGFMGAGKTTVARALAVRGYHLIEMDEQIEEQEGRKISELFETNGEEYFRRLETELLEGLADKADTVVSCGGGVPMRECNVAAMKKSGTVIYLSAEPETIYDRVRDSHTRPLLEGNMNIAYIRELMQKRQGAYLAAADVVIAVDQKSAEQIAEEILESTKADR